MSESAVVFLLTHPISSNSSDRSLIPEYFPPGEKVEDPEPIEELEELSESGDETEPSDWQLFGFVLSLAIIVTFPAVEDPSRCNLSSCICKVASDAI